MPDPTTTYSYTTAAVPEWAEAATVGVPKMLAEIERLRDVANGLWEDYCDANVELGTRAAKIAYFEQELADVKAECCRLTDDNGDLASELVHRDAEYAYLVRAAQDVVNAYENGGMITPIRELTEALAALGKAKEPVPAQSGQEPCTECATSFWAPNPDCEHCMRREKAAEGLGVVTFPPVPAKTKEAQ